MTLKFKDKSEVEVNSIFREFPSEKKDIVLATRTKPQRFLFSPKREIGFCIFKEGEFRKYVSYSQAKRRIKLAAEQKISRVTDRDYYFSMQKDYAGRTLKKIEQGCSIEELAQDDTFIEVGLEGSDYLHKEPLLLKILDRTVFRNID